MKRLFLISSLLLMSQLLFSQTITTGATIQDYVQNVLIGNGIQVSNITINTTDPNVIGEFEGFAATNLGLDHGIVVGCGDITQVLDAAGTNTSETVGSGSDPDLEAISTATINDAIVIEFDFVPLSNHVEFRYVFGSEEFPEYVNAGYNDAFGFFISGPNPTGGPAYVGENIALIPGGTTPVTIDNIFSTSYYIDNASGTDIVYDGFTEVMTASADVVPCVSYHIKLAIGDAGDSAFDSGFFLDAFSFSANALDIDLDFTDVINDSLNTVIEGCTSVDIEFTLSEAFDVDSTFNFVSITGTAINGVDYQTIPGGITFLAGDTTATLTIDPILDGLLSETDETIQIIIPTSACGYDTLNFTIQNNVPVVSDFDITASLCEGETNTITFTGEMSPNDTYVWNFDGGTVLSGTGMGPYEVEWDTYGLKNVSLVITAEDGCSTSSHSEPVEVKQMPTCDFSIVAPICHNGTTQVIYENNNSPQIPCPTFSSWNFNSNITTTATGDPCVIDVSAENLTSDPIYYNMSLQVTYNGCTSDVCIDSLLVFPQGVSGCCIDPVAYAGEDTSLCGLEYTLDASIAGGGNHGQWIYVSGPTVFFNPGDQGTEDVAGDKNAHITVANAGTVVLVWREWSGECFDDDTVSITFFEDPNITFSQEEYEVCGFSGAMEAISSVNPGTTFEWINNYGTAVLSPMNTFNTTVTVSDTGTYTFPVIGTVGGMCVDTGYVDISFYEIPVADAGPDNSVCGTIDTLQANSTYGGYWEVVSSPSGGTNCSAIFTNHQTGELDIYDPNAVISVTCLGFWQIQWHEVNYICESTDVVEIEFTQSSLNITTDPSPRTCYDYAQVSVDTTGYSHMTWFWRVDTSWAYNGIVDVQFNAYDPLAIIYRDFPDHVFGDSGHVDIPFVVTLIGNGCTTSEPSIVTFYQRPEPFLGRDTTVCDDHLAIEVKPTIPVNISEQIWYDNDYGGTFDAVPNDSYITTVNANLGDSLYLVFSEENILGNNHPSCLVKDTILVEFLKRPTADAGDDEYHICGNCIQLDASLDNSVNSVGRWLINDEGFYGYSCNDNNSEAVADSNAWFYHSTDINPGVDTIYVHWLEHNAKSAQCYDVDSVPIYFWYQDTAYIKLNGTVTDIDSTCGRVYENISGNDTVPTNQYAHQTWWSADGNPIDWYYNGSPGAVTEPQLDSIQVVSIGQQDHVWRDIYFVIENGDIYGSEPAVCIDTSRTVSIRFDNPVIAEISESYSYPEPLVVCGDTTCLTATSIFDWSHVYWATNDYSYFQNGYTGDRGDTLVQPCLAAPSNIYPDADTITGGDTHNQIILQVHNGMCIEYDTINVRWAPIPSGSFEIEQPACAGTAATLTVNRDVVTGFDKHITEIEWFFEEDDEPTSIVANNLSQDTIHVTYANSADNEDYRHAVSVKTTNIWGCTYRIYPPDTIFEPFPSYVEWIDEEHPTCGECDGLLSFRNYSETKNYSVIWANNSTFNNSTDDIINFGDTITIDDLCASTYYLKVSYQSEVIGNCNDTLVFDLHADSSTVATTGFEFVTDTTDLQVPFELDLNSINNTSVNANKYTWQIFNGTEEDLALMVWEGYDEIPEYIFTNSGEYLVKLQAFNDKAPNCPAAPVDATIFVHYESVLEVPNVFTPNGDLLNDEFRVKARELATYKCVIYNRWGEKVFETEDPTEAWNGKKNNNGSDLSSGSYFYVITGTGKKGQDFEFKGAVQLLKEK